ncbi:hypothetical protein [Kaistia adipata]|uniref:hypothetical protein n=1 Tax=Kaistia adipata TaxID=166954 RepID=UPI000419E548|nr:hypothetical protein [Kaistia adipata]
MTVDKPALGQKSSERRSLEVERDDAGLMRRALLRTAVYAGLITLSIMLWWIIARAVLGG